MFTEKESGEEIAFGKLGHGDVFHISGEKKLKTKIRFWHSPIGYRDYEGDDEHIHELPDDEVVIYRFTDR